MESIFSKRTDRPEPGNGPSGASGEARRLRLSEFHQNKRRAPSFYARAHSAGHYPSAAFETDRKEPRPEPVRRPPPEERKGRGPWTLWLVGALIVGGLAAASASYLVGAKRGRVMANREIEARARTLTRLPEDDALLLNQAVADLRTGDARRALGTLETLQAKFPKASSLNYLAALAALQAGQPIAAESYVKESLRLGQRLSDSLALQAVLEKSKRDLTGEGKARAEELLRAAITADAANPRPHFELAMMLRGSNRREDARRELRAALSRLNPIDSHAVIETTLGLMNLEETKDASLPIPPSNLRALPETFSSAYIAMRHGNFAEAASALRTGQTMTNRDVFAFLINDPVFSAYRHEKQIAPFCR